MMLTIVMGAISAIGIGGAVVAAVFFPTVVMPVIAKVVSSILDCKPCLIALGIVAAGVGGFFYAQVVAHRAFSQGHAAAIAEIAAEDTQTIARALEKRGEWQKCRNASGSWDQTTGICK